MMYNEPMLPIISENQRNLLISLAYTVSQQKLANVAKLVTAAANPRSASECFEIDPLLTLMHEANAARLLIKSVNAVIVKTPDAFPITVQVNWLAIHIINKALDDTSRIVEAFRAVGDPDPEVWWYNRLDLHISPETDTADLYVLIGSLRALATPHQPFASIIGGNAYPGWNG